jgi:transposase-like protein
LAAIQNQETAAQLASRFGVHPTMISAWKRHLLDGAAELFDKGRKGRKQAEARTDLSACGHAQAGDLYRQIGRLKVENDL